MESVTRWLESLRGGSPAAAQRLWGRYMEQLVRLASARLGGSPRRAADEEDVALVAFEGFLEGMRDGRFPRVEDRDDLWQVLVMLTERRAVDQIRRLSTGRRGGGMVLGETAFLRREDPSAAEQGIAQVGGDEPEPAFAALFADEVADLLRCLEDDSLRAVANARLRGHSNEEIAAREGKSLRTIERKLQLIRRSWERREIARALEEE
jgi:DNA-directed RNA polymerase specialized sigma24 family protein